MTFGQAMQEVAIGKRVRRLEWAQKETYLALNNNQLSIFKPEDKNLHPLIVSLGDILGDDWVIVGH